MEGKNSFVLYTDLKPVVEKLIQRDREKGTNNAGELLYHILRYVTDEDPEPINDTIDLVFEPVKQTLKRDLRKWEKYVEKQRDNGKKGGRPKKPKETQKTQAFFEKPKKADSVSANVSVSVNENENEKKKGGRQATVPTLDQVISFFKENGYSEQAAKKAFDYYQKAMEETGGRVWKDSQGNTVRNWKQKMRGVWFKPDNEIKKTGSDRGFCL